MSRKKLNDLNDSQADFLLGSAPVEKEEKPTDEPKKAEQKTRKKPQASSNKAPYQKSDVQQVRRGNDNSIGKSASGDYDKVTVYMRADIAHALRVVCAHGKMEMSGYVESAVLGKLEHNPIGKSLLEHPDVLNFWTAKLLNF